MTNNDILRRLRYALSISNDQMVDMFAKGNLTVTHAQLHGWLIKEAEEGEEQEAGFAACPDSALSQFLDGFILVRRGAGRCAGPGDPEPDQQQHDPAQAAHRPQLQGRGHAGHPQAGPLQSLKSELSALFRSRDHKHYQDCGDQILRNFLIGLTAKYRG